MPTVGKTLKGVTTTVGKVAGGVTDVAGKAADTIGDAVGGAIGAVGRALPIGDDGPGRTRARSSRKSPRTRAIRGRGGPSRTASGPANLARVTVGPKRAGGWQVRGGGESHDVATQKQGIVVGKAALSKMGGGELVVKGRDGRVRMQSTYGGPASSRSKGRS